MIRANSLPEAAWRKSTYSSDNGGACVEVVDGLSAVPVRDSKNKEGAALVVSPSAWASFVNSVK
ncbi:DUF397 domain-containing protein [Streptomyces caeruleatus]|uniref:DUF397 domain-containing protein n=1 Tax=Streptomyces caeruleatus TaxID=661399 RepID=UPI000ABC5BCF|nr:DUF397 domain-containing protein [Streptomyces caeruleatus]